MRVLADEVNLYLFEYPEDEQHFLFDDDVDEHGNPIIWIAASITLKYCEWAVQHGYFSREWVDKFTPLFLARAEKTQ
jgi:hypothetical protein